LKKKPLIVGIDPGTTTAIGFLDAEGHPLETKSGKKYSKEEIIKEIREKGSLMILGTDKNPLPSALREVATQFKCKVNVPNEDLSQERKNNLTRKYNDMISNEHEKDALASAIQAYRSYHPQLQKIKHRNPEKYQQVVRKKLLKEETIEKDKKDDQEKQVPPYDHEKQRSYKQEIDNLKNKLKNLREKLKQSREEKRELKKEVKNLKKEKGIKEREDYLQSTIMKLEHEKSKLKNKIQDIIETLERDELKTMNEKQMRNTKYTESREKFQELKKKGKKALLIDIVHEEPDKIYYRQIKRNEPSKDTIKNLIDKYKQKRK